MSDTSLLYRKCSIPLLHMFVCVKKADGYVSKINELMRVRVRLFDVIVLVFISQSHLFFSGTQHTDVTSLVVSFHHLPFNQCKLYSYHSNQGWMIWFIQENSKKTFDWSGNYSQQYTEMCVIRIFSFLCKLIAFGWWKYSWEICSYCTNFK